MARIVCKISCVAIFNLLFTSIFTDGIILKPYEENPIVGRPFKLECNTETTIVATVDIKHPDDTIIGSCVPASPPFFPATCSNADRYEARLNESAYTIQVNTSSMDSDVNGTWVCLHNGQTATFTLDSPLTEIIGERLQLTPFTKNITTTSVSLTATYECINKPVYFKWFVEDESSQEKTKLEFANTVIEKKSSLCMNYSGFDAYTETRSSSSVPNRNGRYRICVEVHYSGEVTSFLSIQYFDTYFSSSRGTNTPTKKDATAHGIQAGCLAIAYTILMAMFALRDFIRSTGKISGKCFLTFCQFIEDTFFDCCGNRNSKKNKLKLPKEECLPRTTTPSVVVKGDPDFITDKVLTLMPKEECLPRTTTPSVVGDPDFITDKVLTLMPKEECLPRTTTPSVVGDPDFIKDKVLTLNWLLGFVYLVLYGLIVGVIVLPAVYYGHSIFQERLVIGVGFGIVLLLSGLCLLVVWKFFKNEKSK